jgi:hypothetical protein
MADSFKRLYKGQPGTSAATVYTVPAGKQAIIKQIRAVLVAGADSSIGLFNGGTDADDRILPDVPLRAGSGDEADGYLVDDGTLTLDEGDTIAAVAGHAAAVTLMIYGDEVDKA